MVWHKPVKLSPYKYKILFFPKPHEFWTWVSFTRYSHPGRENCRVNKFAFASESPSHLLFPEFHSRAHLSLRQPRAARDHFILAWPVPSSIPHAVSSFCTTVLSTVCYCLLPWSASSSTEVPLFFISYTQGQAFCLPE